MCEKSMTSSRESGEDLSRDPEPLGMPGVSRVKAPGRFQFE